MPLRFSLRTKTTVPLEVEGITPDVVRSKSLTEIEKLEIFEGNVKTRLAEFFSISGDAADEIHEWEGNLGGVHWIGTKMLSGKVVIHGNAGRHVGSEMRGGEIHVLGDASDWVGGEMHGGLIHVRGKAGHLVLTRLQIESYEREEYLLFSGFDDDGGFGRFGTGRGFWARRKSCAKIIKNIGCENF